MTRLLCKNSDFEVRTKKNIKPSSCTNFLTYVLPHCTASILISPCCPSFPSCQITSLACISIALKLKFFYKLLDLPQTGKNLRNLRPAHSFGAVTFSEFCLTCSQVLSRILLLRTMLLPRKRGEYKSLVKTLLGN